MIFYVFVVFWFRRGDWQARQEGGIIVLLQSTTRGQSRCFGVNISGAVVLIIFFVHAGGSCTYMQWLHLDMNYNCAF